MAKRPKQGEAPPKSKPFNNPFVGVKLRKDPPAAAPVKTVKTPPRRPAAAPRQEDEGSLFLQAMDGVVPIPDRGPAPPTPQVPLPAVISDDAEALMQLAELVSKEGSFNLSDSDEYLQGASPNMDPRVVRALRRGEYPVQARLDLHGLTRAAAQEAVESFLTRCRREGRRCVLLVHGRGLNSKDQLPVLKESVQTWLIHGRLGRSVLAFASARPQDGGAGAVYVLLRKARG